MVNQNEKHPDSALIDGLGGTNKAAEFFDVSAPSISEWRRTGLPKARRMYLELARPDLFLTGLPQPQKDGPSHTTDEKVSP